MKLKRNEIAVLRTKLHQEQDRKCALCTKRLKLSDAVLDHDHLSGHCRAVIHADCNVLLGKVENYTSRHGKRMRTENRLSSALKNIWEYMLKDWTHNPLHPSHLTETDKLARKYRRLVRQSKKPETKEKWRKKLRELK